VSAPGRLLPKSEPPGIRVPVDAGFGGDTPHPGLRGDTPHPSRPEPGATLLQRLHARRPDAERWLLDHHAGRVERILLRILGDAGILEDLVQDVFVRVFARIDDVREPEALRGFVTSVSVFVAREAIRKRRRHRWLAFFASDELPEIATGADADADARDGVRAFYRAIDVLDPDERVAFTLRRVEGLELTDVAAACGVSLATVKRRIQRAEETFVRRCREDEILSRWLAEGDRWP
jgi:RNA polymerase sigma-70 factor, ECF subfamily